MDQNKIKYTQAYRLSTPYLVLHLYLRREVILNHDQEDNIQIHAPLCAHDIATSDVIFVSSSLFIIVIIIMYIDILLKLMIKTQNVQY
jgi:hypothetical protein